jgi:hypothetical protein
MSGSPPIGRSQSASGALLLGLAVALAGCNPVSNSDTPFPTSVDFTPLEPTSATAAFPMATTNELCPQGLGNIVRVPTFSHNGSHARGYLHANVLEVYQALLHPESSYIHNQNGTTVLDRPTEIGVEPFPLSYRIHYRTETGLAGTTIVTRFDVTYRGGVTQGTEAAPVEIGQRFQKTSGIANIKVMTGSLVARDSTACPGVGITEVEMVEWLYADTQHAVDCDGMLTDLFGDLEAVLATLPP